MKNRQQPVEKVTDDKRFTHVQSDPRFIRPKKGDTKVKVDKRFAHMVKDKDFTETTKVDRYGQLQEDNRAEAYLRNAYDFEDSGSETGSSSSSEESEENEETVVDRARGRGVDSDESSDEEFDSEISDVEWGQQDGGLSDVEEDPQDIPRGEETKRFACVNMDWVNVRAVDLLVVLTAFKPDGGSVLSAKIYPSQFGKERISKEAVEGPPQDIFKKPLGVSDDSSDNEDEDEVEEDEEELDSEKEEADLIRQQVEEGNEEFDQVALRKYEIEKMKYYFAVVECDSVATAQAIYNACDGTEYEATANFFDMRFIPDDMDFDEDTPKDEATYIPEKYEPRDFSSQALQHSRVKLTWDADEPDRTKLTRRAFTQEEIDNMDFGDLLASSSSPSSDDSSDEDGEDKLAQKRALLLAGPDKDSDESDESDVVSDNEKMGDMEITFTPGLSEAAAARMEEKKRAEEEAEEKANETTIERFRRLKKERREKWRESVKEKKATAANGKHKKGSKHSNDDDNLISDNEDESRARTAGDSFFTYSDEDDEIDNAASSRPDSKKTRETKSERKQRREKEDKERAELELLLDGADSGRQHFDINEIIKAEKKKKGKGKGKKKDAEPDVQDDFKLDTSDPRFSALFESHNFAIDPNNPNFKKTKAMKDLLNESRRKRYRMSK